MLVRGSLAAYLVHAVLAVASGRQLYGDAAWFLIRIVSEGQATSFVADFFTEFHHARTLAFWITQGPTVLALHLGLRDLQALSTVLGVTYFASKPLALVVCYRLLPTGEKCFVVFPMLAVFAGAINSDIYIVSETHLAMSLAWPLVIALHRPTPGSDARELLVLLVIAVTCLIHESFVAFAGIMLAVVGTQWHQAGHPRDPWTFLKAGLLGLVVTVNAAGILFPRDPTNKAAFSGGLVQLVRDSLVGVGDVHVGPLVSLVATAGVIALAFAPSGGARRSGTAMVMATGLFLALAPLAHFVVFVDRVRLEDAIVDRGFSGLVMQVVLMVAYLAVHAFRADALRHQAAAASALLGALVAGQVSWQVFATHVWRDATATLRQRLASRDGVLLCPAPADQSGSLGNARAEHVLCKWWVTPLSIVLSPRAVVRSMVLSDDRFQPFDARNPTGLPTLAAVGGDYRPFLAAVGDGRRLGPWEKVQFGEAGRGASMVRRGFAVPEGWGTWTNDDEAQLEVCGLETRREASVLLEFHLAPFIPPGGEPPEVSVSVAGAPSDTWRFGPGDRVVGRAVRVPGGAIPSTGCVEIGLRVDHARSPASLGLSGDPRRLGVALIDLQRRDVP
jgi:hypothetical protein